MIKRKKNNKRKNSDQQSTKQKTKDRALGILQKIDKDRHG